MPLISVIIPVFNTEKYLNDCLNSVLSQSHRDIEVIIIDDGSTDSSPEICDKYAEIDSRIIVRHEQNCGISAARNKGISIAKGDFIGFVDSDDWIEPDMYEHLLSGFSVSEKVKITNGMVLQHDDATGKSWRIYPEQWTHPENRVILGSSFQHTMLSDASNHFVGTKLYDRSIFETALFRNGRNDEDTLFHYEIGKAMEINHWDLVDVPYLVYHYRIRENSTCTSREIPERLDRLQNLNGILNDIAPCHTELVKDVKILRARTCYYFAKEVIANNTWRKQHWALCKREIKRTGISILRKSLGGKHFICAIMIKYTPWLYYLILKAKLFARDL